MPCPWCASSTTSDASSRMPSSCGRNWPMPTVCGPSVPGCSAIRKLGQSSRRGLRWARRDHRFDRRLVRRGRIAQDKVHRYSWLSSQGERKVSRMAAKGAKITKKVATRRSCHSDECSEEESLWSAHESERFLGPRPRNDGHLLCVLCDLCGHLCDVISYCNPLIRPASMARAANCPHAVTARSSVARRGSRLCPRTCRACSCCRITPTLTAP